MSDRTITWKLDVDDASAASKFHQNAEAAKKAAAQQLEQAKASIAASEDRLRFLEKELQDAKRFYAEQKRFAKEAIEDKRQLLALEEKYAEDVFIARAHLRSQGTKTALNNLITSQNRLAEHRSLMGSAIPELDAAPESARAAAAEVDNLADAIAKQKSAIRQAKSETRQYTRTLVEMAKGTSSARVSVYTLRSAFTAFSRLITGDFKGAAHSFKSMLTSIVAHAAAGGLSITTMLKAALNPWLTKLKAALTTKLAALTTKLKAALLNPWLAAVAVMSAPVILKIRHDRKSKQAIEEAKQLAIILGKIQAENNNSRREWINDQKRRDGSGPLGKVKGEASETGLDDTQSAIQFWEKEYADSFEAERKAAETLMNAEGRLAANKDDSKTSALKAKVDDAKKRLDAARSLANQYLEVLEVWKSREEELLREAEQKEREFEEQKKAKAKQKEREFEEQKKAKAKADQNANEAYEQDLKEYKNRVFLGGASSERNMLETELSRLTSDRESVKGDDIAAKQKRLDIDKEILSVNERLGAIDKKELATLRDIKEQAALIGLEREDWLKKRIGQVRERFKEEDDPVEKARLGLMGKELTHELKTLMGVDSGASKEKADTRPLSPTGSGVHMNDMSKVSAGGVKMVAQPFNTNKGEKWKQTGIVGSSSLNELMDLGRGQSPLSVDPQAKIAQNTEKTNDLLEDIRVNLKGVK